MTVITLTAVEQRIAKHLASERNRIARESGRVDRKMGPQSSEATDLEGIGAEIAFCRMANVYPDLDVGHTPDHDATFLGARIDVKATKYANGHLLAVLGKAAHPAEVYALMVGEFPTYRFAGMLPASRLFQAENVKDLGRGPGYAVAQCDLQTVDEWLADYERG